ncbi:MAG: sensor histidine kinase [Candidatus Limiplasma sp.]|nr:sensor histidine kinase [Candidatus Limiplasma sp.]
MNGKRFWALVRGWYGVVRGALWASLLIPAAFVGLHALGWGRFQELTYTLLLVGAAVGILGVRSFIRYAARQLALWEALRNPPPDEAALPAAETEPERCYRALAAHYLAARTDDAQAAADAERERLDYFTLWVHQIKTPIAALDLMAQSDEPVDRELLRQQVFRISQYADAALGYQRLQSLHNDLALTEVPLYPLCCSLVKKLRPLFTYRHIRLNMAPFAGAALSDPKWLGMAITQALTNALKYAPVGGEITVALREPLVLEVRDNGRGIPAEDLPRVFSCGFTGSLGRQAREGDKSTGIGLYLCKQACDKLGHRVTLASPPGGGVTVTFDLRREQYENFT